MRASSFVFAAVAGVAVGFLGTPGANAMTGTSPAGVRVATEARPLPAVPALACMGAPPDLRLPRGQQHRVPARPPRARRNRGTRTQPHVDPFPHDHARGDFGSRLDEQQDRREHQVEHQSRQDRRDQVRHVRWRQCHGPRPGRREVLDRRVKRRDLRRSAWRPEAVICIPGRVRLGASYTLPVEGRPAFGGVRRFRPGR